MRKGGESALLWRRRIPRSHLCHFAILSSSSALVFPDSHPHLLLPPNPNHIGEMAPKKGAAKSKKTSPKKVSAGARHDKEWVPSRTREAELNRLVEAGVLPDRATTGWRLALGESFPTLHTDEVVVFEDYFWRGLGFPVHPFLRDLLELWVVSLCNLHPNTILHISIFIHFCEAYLRILPTSISSITYSS